MHAHTVARRMAGLLAVTVLLILAPAVPASAGGTAGAHPLAISTIGPFVLENWATRKCADLPGYDLGRRDGPVNQYTCNGTDKDNQLWYFDYVGNDSAGHMLYQIWNAKDGYCLDLPGYGWVEAGTKVTEYPCRSPDNQTWYWSGPPDNSEIWLINAASGLCLDVDGHRDTRNDVRLTVWHCTWGDDHDWISVLPPFGV